jgi:hypothetical protein
MMDMTWFETTAAIVLTVTMTITMALVLLGLLPMLFVALIPMGPMAGVMGIMLIFGTNSATASLLFSAFLVVLDAIFVTLKVLDEGAGQR